MGKEYLIQNAQLHNVVILNQNDIYKGVPQPIIESDRPRVDYKSTLGTPIFCNLKFHSGTYTAFDGTVYTIPEIVFDTVILTLNQQKNIVRTEIQGRDGSVKEYIGLGDYNLQISALLNFTNGTYDDAAVADIKHMLTAPVSIKVTSWYLQLWDIDEIVIDSFSVPQTPGYYSQQIININALSDKQFDLILSND